MGLILLAAGQFLLPLVVIIPAQARLGCLLATNGLANLGLGVLLVNGSPFRMGATGPEERNHVYSVQSALAPLSAFVGSLVGGFLPGLFASLLFVQLDHPTPYAYALLVSVALAVPAVIALAATREPGMEPEERATQGAATRPLASSALCPWWCLHRWPARVRHASSSTCIWMPGSRCPRPGSEHLPQAASSWRCRRPWWHLCLRHGGAMAAPSCAHRW